MAFLHYSTDYSDATPQFYERAFPGTYSVGQICQITGGTLQPLGATLATTNYAKPLVLAQWSGSISTNVTTPAFTGGAMVPYERVREDVLYEVELTVPLTGLSPGSSYAINANGLTLVNSAGPFVVESWTGTGVAGDRVRGRVVLETNLWSAS